jgi:hypothetical protein
LKGKIEMNINNARKILAEAQACFQDLKLPLLNESEKLNCECSSKNICFRSWIAKDDKLAEILTHFFIDQDIIELSMNFYENYEESATQRLHEFINGMNYHCGTGFWILHSSNNKIQYRVAQIITEKSFEKNLFKDMLKEFLEAGLYDYSYITRIMKYDVDFDTLLNEWLNPISIFEM